MTRSRKKSHYRKSKYQDTPRKSDSYYFFERLVHSPSFWRGITISAWLLYMLVIISQLSKGAGSAIALLVGVVSPLMYVAFRYEQRSRKIKSHSLAYVRALEIIRKFKPSFLYPYEEPYQNELYRDLVHKMPTTKIELEKAFGSSRADIAVDGTIGIEIKGPTRVKDLQTIADKYLRYSQHFDHVIMVLCNVTMIERRYNEWLRGIRTHYPNIVVIRIDGVRSKPSAYFSEWSMGQHRKREEKAVKSPTTTTPSSINWGSK